MVVADVQPERENTKMIVYLAGPIGAKTPEQANGWRNCAAEALTPHGFLCTSPMRGKEMLKPEQKIGVEYAGQYGDVPELRAQSIYVRDIYDVTRADIILANVSEIEVAETNRRIEHVKTAKWIDNCRSDHNCKVCWEQLEVADHIAIPSLGTDWEMGYAAALRKPIVLVAPADSYYMRHPFSQTGTTVQFTALDDALEWIIRNFGVYTAKETHNG